MLRAPDAVEPVLDDDVLRQLHGLRSADSVLSTLDLEDLGLHEVVIGGGVLRFEARSGQTPPFVITTAYDVTRDLAADERARLLDATVSQWSDGLGSGSFSDLDVEVASAPLGLVLTRAGVDLAELGGLFVDAWPLVVAHDVEVVFEADRRADDEVVDALSAEAAAGNPMAMVLLGVRCAEGDGVDQDATAAVAWFRRAADSGHPRGLHALADCLLEGRGVARDEAAAVALLERGAAEGDAGCAAELGDCLERGRGVPVDLHAALVWYRFALEAGFDAVLEAIERVEARLA